MTESEAERQGIAADSERSVAVGCEIYDARGNGDGLIAPTMTGDHNHRINDYCAVLLQNTIVFDETQITSPQNGNNPQINAPCHPLAATAHPPVICINDEGGQSITVEKEEISPTLRNQAHGNEPVVCYRTRPGYCNGTIYALDRASFNQGLNAQYDIDINDSGINSTLVAKGPGAVAYKHIKWIIRRLIPLECERLQGYPDNWTVIPKITEMTDEQYQFFADVFLLDKQIKGLSAKQPSKDSLIKWYNKLACDGNRYKALGNSLAIPCALRVIAGIAEWEEHQCV